MEKTKIKASFIVQLDEGIWRELEKLVNEKVE
jgi:hypothetical protein